MPVKLKNINVVNMWELRLQTERGLEPAIWTPFCDVLYSLQITAFTTVIYFSLLAKDVAVPWSISCAK